MEAARRSTDSAKNTVRDVQNCKGGGPEWQGKRLEGLERNGKPEKLT